MWNSKEVDQVTETLKIVKYTLNLDQVLQTIDLESAVELVLNDIKEMTSGLTCIIQTSARLNESEWRVCIRYCPTSSLDKKEITVKINLIDGELSGTLGLEFTIRETY